MDARPIDTGASHGGIPADSPSTRAFREASAQMHRDMSVDYTGDADIDFLRAMSEYHEGALAVARIAVEHGEAPEVRNLAEEIIAAQRTEIVRMRVMLARHEDVPVTVGPRLRRGRQAFHHPKPRAPLARRPVWQAAARSASEAARGAATLA